MNKIQLVKMLFLAYLGAATYSIHAASECPIEYNQLKAEYTITATNAAGRQKQTSLILWRHDQQVAHQYPQTEISELWQLVSGNRVKAFRMFDHHQRSIEYQPGESVHGKVEKDWSHRFQLISDHVIKSMQIESEIAEACHSKEILTGSFGDTDLTVAWRPKQKLIESLTWISPKGKEIWQLQNVDNDVTKISEFFEQRYSYYATDFADIGDDHTDPFLTQMTNLGFIEHGASGFYQASDQGIQSAGAGHNHGHAH